MEVVSLGGDKPMSKSEGFVIPSDATCGSNSLVAKCLT